MLSKDQVVSMAVKSQMAKTQHKSRIVPMVPIMHSLDESSPVSPMRGGGEACLNIQALNPDLNGDGHVEPWEKEVYQRLLTADADGSGTVSAKELFGVMRQCSEELKRLKGGIPISDLNPDADGDGKVEAWENDVFIRIQDADEDQSGSISVKELYSVIRKAAESDRQKRLFRRMFLIAAALLVLMLVANTGLTAAVVFLSKDTTVGDGGALVGSSTGEMVRVRCVSDG